MAEIINASRRDFPKPVFVQVFEPDGWEWRVDRAEYEAWRDAEVEAGGEE